MKKTLISLISTLLCVLTIGLLSACDFGTSSTPHTHVFSETVATETYLKSEASCTEKAVYYKSCSCGEKGTDTFEYGEYGEHNLSQEWTTGNGKHWHVCQTSGCSFISDESVHIYTNGICVCGDIESITDTHIVSNEQWTTAFAFTNVTIKQYLVVDGQNIPVGNYLLNENDALFITEEMTIPMNEYANMIRLKFDFSDCYENAEYQNGKYYLASFDVFSDGSYVYENAYLTFENGVLISISATIKEEVIEYDDDFNEIGTTTEISIGYFEFVDYGLTDTTYDNALPITQSEWEAVFATGNFTNMTIVANIPNVTENIYYANGQEKITVNGINTVELYYVNGLWYTYYTDTETFEQTDIFGDDSPFVTLSDSFKNLFSMLKDMYSLMHYDAESDEYYWLDENGGYTLKIENGKLTRLIQTTIIEETTSVYDYTLSNYGATSFSIPFDLNHVCSFVIEQATDEYLVSEATCTQKAIYYKSCSCGKHGTSTFEYGLFAEHYFVKEIVDEQYLNEKATCDTAAIYYKSCECGMKGEEIFSNGAALGCDYGEWISNNDGTHTRFCARNTSHNETKACNGGKSTCTELAVCCECNAEYGILSPHPIAEQWSYNDEYHWHETTCPHNEIVDYEEHNIDTNSGWCTICNVSVSATNGIVYELSSDETYAIVTGYNGMSSKVRIADFYEDVPVTTIKQEAFINQTITHIFIPDNITSIEQAAFRNCSDLLYAEISKNVIEINNSAFYNCTKLEKVNYTGTIDKWAQINFTNASANPLYYSKNLYIGHRLVTEVALENATQISNYAFYNCSSLKNVVISSSITAIGEYAFYGCNGLIELTLPFVGATLNGNTDVHFGYIFGASGYSNNSRYVPQSLKTIVITGSTSIGNNAFKSCSGLESIVLPESLEHIGKNAFYGCSSLKNIIIPNNVVDIGNNAFYNCKDLIYNVNDNINYLGNETVKYIVAMSPISKEIEDAVISSECKFIHSNAFEGCNLKSIVIPDNVVSIGESAFKNCSCLKEITLPFLGASKTTNTEYEKKFGYIFGYTTSSNSTVSGTVCQYNSGSHYYHYYIPSSLAKVVVTNDVINDYAFYNCSDLVTIEISSNIEDMGDYTFYNCKSLKEIVIPAKVTSIGNYTFSGCSSLTFIDIPNNVNAIGTNAFYNCSSLKRVVIPDSVTNITYGAFKGCDSLEEITLPFIGTSDIATGPHQVFGAIFGYVLKRFSDDVVQGATYQYYAEELEGVNKACFYYIPSNLKKVTITGGNINDYAFKNCSNLEYIALNGEIDSIGYQAFYNCENLANIVIPDTIKDINQQAFIQCSNLKYYEKDTLRYLGNEINNYVLLMDTTSTEITEAKIESDCRIIHYGAFYNCINLTSIVIPNNVIRIYENAFRGCSSLEEITLPFVGRSNEACYNEDSVFGYIFGYYPLNNSTPEESAILQYYSATQLPKYYYIPSSLKKVTITGERINSYAFNNCTTLESVTIGSNVRYIGDNAFANCNTLTNVTFEAPDGWKYITKSVAGNNIENALDSSDLRDGEIAMQSLKSKYYEYAWKRD